MSGRGDGWLFVQLPRRSGPSFFFFNDTATTEIYTLSLHDALPISPLPIERDTPSVGFATQIIPPSTNHRSEEHTSELQSPCNLVCRLLLEKKKTQAPRDGLPGWPQRPRRPRTPRPAPPRGASPRRR